MHLHHEGLMIEVQCYLMICRGHIRASKGFIGKLTFKSNFAYWSSFQVKFERVVYGVAVGAGDGGIVGNAHASVHTHAHSCMHYKHDNFMQMAHVCACMAVAPTHPHLIHPVETLPPMGGCMVWWVG